MAYQFTQTGAEIQDILDLAQLQIAAPYDSASSYTAGDYCTKDDGFYVCTASTSGTWDASKWSAVTVGDVLETANANISSLNATLTNMSSSGTWTPAINGANVTSSSGVWQRIGTVVFLVGKATFSSTQTDQGSIYLKEGSLPSVGPLVNNCSVAGVGAGAANYVLSNHDANNNIWISQDGVGRIRATQSGLGGSTMLFNLTAMRKN